MNALRWIGLGIDYVSLRENKINTTQYNPIQPNTTQCNPMQPNANALSRSIAIMDVREKIEKKQDNINSLKGTGTNNLKGTGTNNSNPHEIRDPHGILGLLRTDGSMRSRL
jgi:hypothetical protein